ncbi:MAG: ubiquinol-cytochrome c reductase iron-sulfur subunit [Desulfobacteraceae bacterium]
MSRDSGLDRRRFMEVGIYTITGAITVVSGIALVRFAIGPSFHPEKVRWIEVELDDTAGRIPDFSRVVLEYEKRDGWLTASARSLAYVMRKKQDEVVAISAACTHLGCIVTWDEDQQIFKCPCHNGRYNAEGEVISGPPPKPLRRHRTKIEDNRILLATETVAYGGIAHERS